MKKFRKITATFSALTMMLSAFSGTCIYASAEDSVSTSREVKVSFNITDDMTYSSYTDIELFNDTVCTDTYFTIPKGSFSKDGYAFSGWTVNGIDGLLQGETYVFSDTDEEVVFEPVWYNPKGEKHSVTYNLNYKGEEIEYPEWLEDKEAIAGQFVTPDYTTINIDGAFSRDLILGDDHMLTYGGHFIMPDEDVVITPIWLAEVVFTFYAGDVDRINGNDTYSFPKNEASPTELPASDRFSRSGFNLVGWLSDYDGETYKPLETVTVPGVDVTFTAVWEAKTYSVVFKQGNGGANLKVTGLTDTQIICPEPDITVDGKYFAGWQDTDGSIYDAGSEYTISGAKPGVGIMLTAVWLDGEAPTENTAVSGDANEDGSVNIADATAIVQSISNPDKYALSEQGALNADVDGIKGVSGLDALAIQMLETGTISELPLIQ